MKKITYNQYGTNDVLNLSNIKESEPIDNELLIEIKAASINPIDWKLRQGEMKIMSGKNFPKGIGCDFSGIVKKIGSNVTEFKKGDTVFGWMPYKEAGSFAETIIAKESLLVKKPTNINFKEAACLPMTGATALTALKEKGNIKKGYEILINGCTGGVGHMATQIVKNFGAKITGVCSGDNIEVAKKLGVDNVVDYKKQSIYSLDKKFDIIFDTVGNLSYKKSKTLLKPNGKFLDLNPKNLLDILYGLISSKYKVIMTNVKKGHLIELAKLTKTEKIKPIIGKIVNLDEAIKAISSLEKGEKILGKTIIVN